MLDKEDGIYKKNSLKNQKTFVRPVKTEEETSIIDDDKDKDDLKNINKK